MARPRIEGRWFAYGHEYWARVRGENYVDGGGLAIKVETWGESVRLWEPWCTATVNFPDAPPPEGCVWIKEHDDRGTTRDNLVALGILESKESVATHHSGFVDFHAFRLSEKGKTLWEDDGAWFDETGMLCREIPPECVDAVARSGDNGPAVREWAAKLEFGKNLDQDRARGHVLESGVHTLLEVVGMPDTAVAEWVLWDICWRIHDDDGDPEAARIYGMCDSRRLSQFLKARVCRSWGYENGFDAGTVRMFAEARKVHDKLVELHPDEHGENATDTVRGDHHRWCKCGFDYRWDSSD